MARRGRDFKIVRKDEGDEHKSNYNEKKTLISSY